MSFQSALKVVVSANAEPSIHFVRRALHAARSRRLFEVVVLLTFDKEPEARCLPNFICVERYAAKAAIHEGEIGCCEDARLVVLAEDEIANLNDELVAL